LSLAGLVLGALKAPPLQAVLAVALGALQTLAYVHTWAWPLALLTLAVVVALLNTSSPRHAAVLLWCYGVGWLTAGVWWLFISMHHYGGLPAPLAAAAVLALAAALSLYLAVVGWAYARWRAGRVQSVLLFAALWLLAELARGVLFTGFPWVALGYALVDSPFAGLAPWLGVYGMGAAAAAAAAALAAYMPVVRHQGLRAVAAPAAVGVVLLVGLTGLRQLDFTRSMGTLQVALLQTGVQQDQKFSPEHLPESLAWLSRQLLATLVAAENRPAADLVLAPETAVPLLPSQLQEAAPGYWAALHTNFTAAGRVALVGLPLGDFDSGYTNSVAALGVATPYRYDKLHLVPFGEFIPTGFRWFTELMNIPLGDFARGVSNPPSLPVRGQRVAPNICYEDLFGEELARRFVDPELAPTVLANISNIGWFGNSWAIPQHLNISRLRTLELQRPMLRATNTGSTASIDHQGRVVAQLATQKPGVLTGTVQGRAGTTPFAWWAARAGLWPLGLAAAAAVLCLVWRRRRQGGLPAA
jgi:apolipoprotein N-acyltransferase